MNTSVKLQRALLASVFALTMGLAGCGDNREERAQKGERYVSAQVNGETQRINLQAVQEAFWVNKGNDFNSWMSGFEQRVNEIYEGEDIVSVDAMRNNELLTVTGFIDRNNEPGFQGGDDRLFAIQQTGQAAGANVPYQVAGGDGSVFYQGNYAVGDNDFFEGLLIGGLVGGFAGHYFTKKSHYKHLKKYRTKYRTTSAYKAQHKSNLSFAKSYKPMSTRKAESTRKFGSSTTSTDGTKKRSWTGSGSTGSAAKTTGSSSSWSGRRSTSSTANTTKTSGSTGSSSSWSGRSSSGSSGSSSYSGSSSSSGSSWGGRRSSSSSSSSSSSRRRR